VTQKIKEQYLRVLQGNGLSLVMQQVQPGRKIYPVKCKACGGKDVFVHLSAVEKAGMNGLPDGAKISYDMISDRGKGSAGNLQLKGRACGL
jgi:cold shock CspA family protein